MNFLKLITNVSIFLTKAYNILVKIKLDSTIIRSAWGKLSGHVISYKGKKLRYMRRGYKDKKATPKQHAWRLKYHVVDLAFKDLTDEQKSAWRKFAKVKQNEYSYFMRVNLKRAADGLPYIMWPPEMQGGNYG